MLRKLRKGQGTLEYILLITAVLVVLIALLGNNGYFTNKLNATLTQPMDLMNKYVNKLNH